MIKVIQNIGKDVIGFELSGVVSGDDYEKILVPAVEKKLQEGDGLKVLYHVGKDFDSYELKAMYDDTKVGFKFFGKWKKIAVVSDVEWIIHGAKIFSFAVSGEIRTFSNMEIDAAKKWLQEEEVLHPNITVTLNEKSKIVILKLQSALKKDDFVYAKPIIDLFMRERGSLKWSYSVWRRFSGLGLLYLKNG